MQMDQYSGEEEYCSDCRRTTITVSDYSSGDLICTECGLVLEAKMAEIVPEWRCFADDDDAGAGRSRVGAPVNPLLQERSLTTKIIAPTAPAAKRAADTLLPCSGAAARVAEAATVEKGNCLDLRCSSAYKAISDMCEALGILDYAKNRALEVFKKVEESKIFARKNGRGTIHAACLFVACRLENCARTLNEILVVAPGSTKKRLGQDVKCIEQLLSKMGYNAERKAPTNPGDFLGRFASNLCLDTRFILAAKEAMLNLEMLDIRRTPASLTASIIYMMTLLSDARPLQEIALASQVSENTIMKTYKDLYPHASVLIPTSFATEEELSNLPSP